MSWQPQAGNPAPGWYPDPARRFEYRYWDGARWTEHVTSRGQRLVDPVPGQPAAQSRAATAPGHGGQPPAAAAPNGTPGPQAWPMSSMPYGAHAQPTTSPVHGAQAAPAQGPQASPATAVPGAQARPVAAPANGGQAWPTAPAGGRQAGPPQGQGYGQGAGPGQAGGQPHRPHWITGRYRIPGRVGPSAAAIAARSLERPPLGRRLLQTGLVFAFIIALAGGGFVVRKATDEPTEAPVRVGSSLRIRPLSGWRVADTTSDGALDSVLLTRGSANMAALVFANTGTDAEGLLKDYLRLLDTDASNLETEPEHDTLTLAGQQAVRIHYQGRFRSRGPAAAAVGQITAVISPSGNGIVFDAWSLPAVFPYQEGDVQTMIEEAEIS